MRSRCFGPEVKFLFFKKVRDVFRALAKKIDATFKIIQCHVNSEHVTRWDAISQDLGQFGKKYAMDTLEHLEKELEALLWICFSSRYLFSIFEDFFFQLFSSKSKNRYLELKNIQRRASNCISKCSNVSIAYFFSNLTKPLGILDTHQVVECSDRYLLDY